MVNDRRMNKIFIALDELESVDEIRKLVSKIAHLVHVFKIHNVYDKYGPNFTKILKDIGANKVWNDVKLFDIPNTARLRARDINADIISVHASGDVDMMKKAVDTGKEVFAITVLTSMKPERVMHIFNRPLEEQVMILAQLAKEAGVSGIVCSPLEVKMLREKGNLGGIKLIVPGIRSVGVDKNDQNRVATPSEALLNGASCLVIGRQVTQAPDPVEAIEKIRAELEEAGINWS